MRHFRNATFHFQRFTRMPSRKAVVEAIPAGGASSSARSLNVLALLAREGRPLTLAELAARLELPKATAHRICEQLIELRFLARDVQERSFVVGPLLHRLAYDTLNHGVVRGLRHEVLAGLVGQIGETCNFTTFDGAQVLYLDRVEAAWPLRLTLDVGSHVPLHCTASGKLFLAFMAAEERAALLGHLTLARMTAATLVTTKSLLGECERIARAGYSCDREEFIAGLIAVAVPVRDRDGAVRAAIAVHAPVARMSLRRALSQLEPLRDAAKKMERLL
jgi:DNA-binding IclR family transcriptional regulator